MNFTGKMKELMNLAAHNSYIAALKGDVAGNHVNYGMVTACAELFTEIGSNVIIDEAHVGDMIIIKRIMLNAIRVDRTPSMREQARALDRLTEKNKARDEGFALGQHSGNDGFKESLNAIIAEHNAFVDYVGTLKVPLEHLFAGMGISNHQSRLAQTITQQARRYGIDAKYCAQSGRIYLKDDHEEDT